MIIEHTHNEGYGASLRDGINAAQGDFIVIIDADCEYAPEIIPQLIAELRQGKPVVYASRFLQGDCANVDAMPRFKVLGNKIISQLFNFLFHQRVTDLYTGCKALRRECVRGMHMKRNGFEQVLEIAVLLTQQGYRIDEVPVVFAPRSSGVSKMSHIVETAKYLFWLLFYRLKFIRPPVRKV
jgi:glycosyltransferase involved in cell wall biosynthesis